LVQSWSLADWSWLAEPGARGYLRPVSEPKLTRWLIEPEPHPGVFVGHVNAMVRDRLWTKCCDAKRTGGVVQAWSTNNEQRLQMRTAGTTKRSVVDLDGLQLIHMPRDDS
jgi:CRISPR-associated protein Cas2